MIKQQLEQLNFSIDRITDIEIFLNNITSSEDEAVQVTEYLRRVIDPQYEGAILTAELFPRIISIIHLIIYTRLNFNNPSSDDNKYILKVIFWLCVGIIKSMGLMDISANQLTGSIESKFAVINQLNTNLAYKLNESQTTNIQYIPEITQLYNCILSILVE